jgi:hypothetical protein
VKSKRSVGDEGNATETDERRKQKKRGSEGQTRAEESQKGGRRQSGKAVMGINESCRP